MSKKKPHKKIEGRFLQIEWEFIGSDIWLLLSHAERTVYVEMRREWQRTTFGDYSKAFSCPYDFLSCSSGTASKAIKRLIKFGILEIVEHGGLYRNCTLYRFLYGKWRDYKPDEKEQRTLGRLKSSKVARRKANQARRVDVIRKYNKMQEHI